MRFLLILGIALFSSITFSQVTDSNNTIVLRIKKSPSKSTNIILNEVKNLTQNNMQELKCFYVNKTKETISEKYDLSNIYILKLNDPNKLYQTIKVLKSIKDITYVEPYPVSYILEAPNDPYIKNQYYVDNTRMFEAHEISKGDTNIVIGIIDSGVDLLHQDLKDNYKYNYNDPINNIDDDGDGYVDNFYGWDLANNDYNPQSEENNYDSNNFHGTAVSGLASATTNNEIGIAGMGYHTKLMPIKTMDNYGRITAGYEGILYAAEQGCDIINCSWGNNTYSQFAQDVINFVSEHYGCLVVAAAGNRGAATDKRPDTWFYPASYDNVFSVAATGPTDSRWIGSSYAITVDVSAPGEGTYTTKQYNTYGNTYGTSSAAPLVSGLAGLVKAKNPSFTNKQIAEQIRITCDYIDSLPENAYYSKQLGFGRINAERALSMNNLPSIRIDSFHILDEYKLDTLKVSFIGTNYLAQATNTTIRLTTNSDFVIPISNVMQTGNLQTFEQVSNTVFTFKIQDDMPYNEPVWFEFNMIDEGYNDYQIFEWVLKKDYITIVQDKISTTLTSNGKIGFANWDKEYGIGLKYKNEYLLSNAGIILGNNSTNMASALYDKEEFTSLIKVDTNTIDGLGLFGYDKLKTQDETGLNLSIDHTTLIVKKKELENTIIHSYVISNTSLSNINDLKLAHFADWDLDNPLRNKVQYIDELNMAYTYSQTSNVIYTAICLLNNMSAVPYAFDLIAGGNGGIDITQGFSNELKWYTMTHKRDTVGNSFNSNDIANMLTTDYFDILAGDSTEIAFAHIIGTNLNELTEKASMLIDTYNVPVAVVENKNELKVYPNPAQNAIYFENLSTENGKISIYTSNGIKVKELKIKGCKNSETRINIKNLKSGLYFILYTNNSTSKTGKFIKTD